MIVACWLEDPALLSLEARHTAEDQNIHGFSELTLHFDVLTELFVLLKVS
jgi:hypothetical protein